MENITTEQFLLADVRQQLLWLREGLQTCAVRCKGNMLTEGSWMEGAFDEASERVTDIIVKSDIERERKP